MREPSNRADEIEAFIIDEVTAHPDDIARVTAEHFGISRQAVHRHLARLLSSGVLIASGATRSRRYELALQVDETFALPVSPALEEHRVWEQSVAPLLKDVPENVKDICSYGFTEILNNVIDHSGSPTVGVSIKRSAVVIDISILDEGVGIFHKLATELHLEDERYAVLELCKGKLTTDPTRHSGEGIFFTSRMFDHFWIRSGHLMLICAKGEDWLLDGRQPWLVEEIKHMSGTAVFMKIDPRSTRTQTEVFDRFSDKEEDYGFTRTHVPVALARHGEGRLISRSEAKRLLARFDRFKEVLLDFAGVETIGQAFADEVFRVFQRANPDVKLTWINAAPPVERMIRRALTAS